MTTLEVEPAVAARTGNLSVRFVTKLGDMEALRDVWRRLERAPADHAAAFFQSFAWCHHVASVREAHAAGRYGIAVAVIYDGREIVGIWPLSRQRRGGIWTLRNLDDPFGQFAGVLCRDSQLIEACVRAVLGRVRALKMADAVCIQNALTGTPLQEALLSLGYRAGASNDVVQVDMRGMAAFGDYLKTINVKTRKNLRNAMNRLSRTGAVEHVVVEQPEALASLIGRTFEERLSWLRAHGKSTDAFREPDFRHVIDGASRNGELSLLGFELRVDGEAIAAQWGFVYGGRYYAYISSRGTERDQFSPGRLHLGNVIEACKDRGLDVLELMAPAAPYKVMWANRVTPVVSLWRALSLRGHAAMGVVEMALPAARGVFRMLPQGVRSKLAGKINVR